jgi:purine-binding chemotaxis protein CheW
MEIDATKIMDKTVNNRAEHEGKYLTISMAGEEYGIGILKVKKIILDLA